MPVRKIPKNYRSVTGFFQSYKNGRAIAYESLLERDFFLLQEFDSNVSSYEEQPFTIQYARGKNTYNYTPDCLLHFNNGSPTCVIEVKFTDEIHSDKTFYEEKFNSVEEYLSQNDMDFKLVTELDIRSAYLENAKFLYRYAFLKDEVHLDTILKTLTQYSSLSVTQLLSHIDTNPYRQLELLSVVWFAVFRGFVKVDMDIPLSNSSVLRI